MQQRSLRNVAGRLSVRIVTGLFHAALVLLDHLPKRTRVRARGARILLTGTFYSDAWIATHLRPLAAARDCAKVVMVAARPLPAIAKVEAAYPPPWLRSLAGSSGARTLLFVFLAIRTRPDFVGGFHMLLNGLFALLLAPMVGARSIYFCGGGRREIEGGGYNTENRLYRRLGYPDALVERWLIDAARRFDIIVTMGSSGRDYFASHQPRGRVIVVPGGFDDQLFTPNLREEAKYDLILVGRLSPVKRVDMLIRTVASLRAGGLTLTAVIVGDGPSRRQLEQLSAELGTTEQIEFVGYRDDVHVLLQRSSVFVLTSESEGLSQAMVQGMLCALPAVVTNVGDLRDLVDHGVSGFLIDEPHEERLHSDLQWLFEQRSRVLVMGKAARDKALNLSITNVTRQWEQHLSG
jgi:glycosyltransferase involved in cell wall biosynthesis